jgi:hypothetical protein
LYAPRSLWAIIPQGGEKWKTARKKFLKPPIAHLVAKPGNDPQYLESEGIQAKCVEDFCKYFVFWA